MKKTLFALILILLLVFAAFAQTSTSASGPAADLILLLDTTSGMGNFYHETSEYLIGPFLREHLRIGDTFHLISFAGTPKFEISRRIEGLGDIETVIARLLLMYPLDPRTNLAEALSFAESYSSSLPQGRPRRLFLISDGSAPNTQNLVDDASARFRRQGAELQFIRVPVTGVSSSVAALPGQAGQAAPGQAAPGQVAPGQTAPSDAAQAQTAPGQVAPGQTDPGQTAPGQTAPGQAAPGVEGPATTQPGTTQPGPPAGTAGSASADSSFAGGVLAGGIPLPLLIALAILALLALGLIIFFASRRLHSSPNRVMAKAAAPVGARDQDGLMDSYADTQRKQARPPLEQPPPRRSPPPKDKIDYVPDSYDGGPIMLNLFVEDQNTAIGRRNIHSVKSGGTFTVGGGNSDFLIFLVPIPARLAEIRFDGRNCTFIPRLPKYFPDIGSQSVSNCIGKTIRIISDRGYELFIRMERYKDPLETLNKLLNSIMLPGPVK